MNDLHAALLDAHAAGDARALVALYTQAADAAPDPDAAAFFLTHAYVFALDADDPRAQQLYDRLHRDGRI